MTTPVKASPVTTTSENAQPTDAPLTREAVEAHLGGFDVVFRDQIGSTSDLAASLVEHRLTDRPLAVVADKQVAGRGRWLRTWNSVDDQTDRPTGLTVTFCFAQPDAPPPTTSMSAAVRVRRAIGSLGVDIRLKWPNDLLIGDDKVGGILCEHVAGHDLIGIGINTDAAHDWPDGRGATDLHRLDLLRQLGTAFGTWADTPDRGWSQNAEAFADGLAWVGRHVIVEPGGMTGRFDGVGRSGLPIIDAQAVRASSMCLAKAVDATQG